MVNTDGLGKAIAAQQEGMLVALLDEANETIADLQEQIVGKNSVIQQYAKMAVDQALEVARLRLRCENDAALAKAVAARNARHPGVAEAEEYAASCQRTAEYQR